jgi:uncharacterized repeat protein (TIGR01451 family)
MKKNLTLLSFMFVLIAAATATAHAAPKPNLRVTMTSPNAISAYTPYQYSVTVKNIGNAPAANVKVVVDLPETDTSPTKYILGTVSGLGTGCTIVARKIQCATTGNLGNNQQRVYTFNLALPVSSKVLQIRATGSTTTPNEQDANNNTVTKTPVFNYPANPLTSADVLISMCTGRNLSSFFECELFPSSQQHHVFTLNPDTTVEVYGQIVGNWDQVAGSNRLHMLMNDGSGTIVEFQGYASNTTCFEGKTTFTPSPSGFMAIYRACVQ